MIAARDLQLGYDGAVVLAGLSFDVTAGETFAVMGANGTGKTTLLRLLAGLAEPDGGRLRIGEGVGAEGGRAGGNGDGTDDGDGAVVGLGPENPGASLFAETVRDEVAFFPRNRGLDADRRAERAMRDMAVFDLRDRDPFSLSVGEQRRVSIAAILAGDPDVVALDEPTVGLDRRGERRLGDLVSALDATVVFSTHDADFAFAVADRVGVLDGGRFDRTGPARSVLSDLELLERRGIRPPGVVAWARRRGLDRVPADVEEAARIASGSR